MINTRTIAVPLYNKQRYFSIPVNGTSLESVLSARMPAAERGHYNGMSLQSLQLTVVANCGTGVLTTYAGLQCHVSLFRLFSLHASDYYCLLSVGVREQLYCQ